MAGIVTTKEQTANKRVHFVAAQ